MKPLLLVVALSVATPAVAADAVRDQVGLLADGTALAEVTLSNARGIEARVITYGATLQSLVAPDRNGVPAEVTLGYDNAAEYEAKPNYFGVTVGRYANRIAGGRFSLDGRSFQLPQNNSG